MDDSQHANHSVETNLNGSVTNDYSTALQAQERGKVLVYAVLCLRVLSCLAIVANSSVLLLLIRLKKTFRNYNYWFQILVLSSEDLFNGVSSLAMSFFTSEVFMNNYIACCTILWAYMCSQLNTLWAICCICINRFRRIQSIDKLGEMRSGYLLEISVVTAAVFSAVYALFPYFIWNIKKTDLPSCTPVDLFVDDIDRYKLTMSVGLLGPLFIIDVLYGICLFKLRRASSKVKPETQRSASDMGSCSQATKDTVVKNNCNSNKAFGLPGNSMQYNATDPISVQDGNTNISLTVPRDGCSNTSKETASIVPAKARIGRRETQVKAVRMLGIVLFLSNIATVLPVSFMIRDIVMSAITGGNYVDGGGTAVGIIFLSLNSLVDSFVYGLYSAEIRNFLREKCSRLWQSVISKFK